MKAFINHQTKEAWLLERGQDLADLKGWTIYVESPPLSFGPQVGYEVTVGGMFSLDMEVRIGPPSPPPTPCCSCCRHKPAE